MSREVLTDHQQLRDAMSKQQYVDVRMVVRHLQYRQAKDRFCTFHGFFNDSEEFVQVRWFGDPPALNDHACYLLQNFRVDLYQGKMSLKGNENSRAEHIEDVAPLETETLLSVAACKQMKNGLQCDAQFSARVVWHNAQPEYDRMYSAILRDGTGDVLIRTLSHVSDESVAVTKVERSGARITVQMTDSPTPVDVPRTCEEIPSCTEDVVEGAFYSVRGIAHSIRRAQQSLNERQVRPSSWHVSTRKGDYTFKTFNSDSCPKGVGTFEWDFVQAEKYNDKLEMRVVTSCCNHVPDEVCEIQDFDRRCPPNGCAFIQGVVVDRESGWVECADHTGSTTVRIPGEVTADVQKEDCVKILCKRWIGERGARHTYAQQIDKCDEVIQPKFTQPPLLRVLEQGLFQGDAKVDVAKFHRSFVHMEGPFQSRDAESVTLAAPGGQSLTVKLQHTDIESLDTLHVGDMCHFRHVYVTVGDTTVDVVTKFKTQLSVTPK